MIESPAVFFIQETPVKAVWIQKGKAIIADPRGNKRINIEDIQKEIDEDKVYNTEEKSKTLRLVNWMALVYSVT